MKRIAYFLTLLVAATFRHAAGYQVRILWAASKAGIKMDCPAWFALFLLDMAREENTK